MGTRKIEMRKKGIFLYLVVLFLAFSFIDISCSSKDEEIYVDVLSHYDVLEKKEPTYLIDFTSSQTGDYLLKGWSGSEATHTWAEGLESDFIFYAPQGGSQGDIEMTITCAPFTYPGSPEQKMGIYLNGKHLEQIALKPSLSDYTISLPSNLLKTKNIVTFKYAYAARPCDRLPNSKDQRNLSVMFKSMEFNHGIEKRDSSFKKTKNSVIQYPNSVINYYFELRGNSRVFFNYKIKGDVKPSVEFAFDNGQLEKIDLPSKQSKFVQDLSAKHAKIAKMSLVVRSNDGDSSVTWKSIKLYGPKQKSSLAERSTIKDKSDREKFQNNKKPDIVLYVVDALRSDHLSCYDYSRMTSPYLDAFARENTLFLDVYANSSWTRASGATILTGLLPENHKTMARDSSLPKELQTLPEILRDNGYYTVAFITNGNVGKSFSFDQGFDEYIQPGENTKRESVHVRSNELNKHIFKFLDGFLKRENRKPLFAFIWSSDPHNPYTPERSVVQTFGIDKYAPVDFKFGLLEKLGNGLLAPSESQLQYIKTLYDQEVFFNDKSFGDLLNKLKQKNIYENSIIIFTADHGEEFKDHGGYGHGLTLYNEVIKIPLVIKAREIKTGTIDTKVQLADIFPTILDILDIKLPYKVDGESLCNSEQLGNRYIFSQEQLDGNDVYSILYEGYKFIYNVASNRPPRGGGVVPRYELYDLRTDMPERNDLAESKPLRAGYLHQMLKVCLTLTDGVFRVKEQKVTLTPKLDKQLRDLGYVR